MSRIKQLGVAAGIAALATVAGATTYRYVESSPAGGKQSQASLASSQVASRAAGSKASGAAGSAAANTKGFVETGKQGTFIVLFREEALATYKGVQPTMVGGKRRLDAKSAQSQTYVKYLQGRQQEIRGAFEQQIGRKLAVRHTMQHAINGIVTDLTKTEAALLRGNPDVRLVEAYTEYAVDTDRGPTLIGAVPVWSGTNPGATQSYQGEGMVLGIIDSGINFESPSFAATSPVDSYAHVNPRGAGNYLGTCIAGGVDAGRCNDKLIGGYDFVCGPPANQCGVTNIREEPGFGDTNGHGTHTASTAGGNRRDVSFRGNTIRISGVAPRANVIAYDVCYTNTATGQGLCPNSSTAAAIDQATADNVDAINYSIGGGTTPWSDAVSIAFRNAVNAGTYVSASAGNSGPGPNTMGHLQPWVSSTAAAQHGRGDFVFALQITAPTPVPAALQAIVVNEGSGGVAHSAAIPNTTPVRISPNIDAANDGCNAGTPYAAGAFTGSIAVVRRGSCAFSEKAANAATAGALTVIIANNAAGAIAPSVPGATIRAFGMLQADGNALRDFAATNPSAVTGGINFPAAALSNTADALASFSSRGPAGTFDLVKPDVTAPGSLVLAAVSPTAAVTGAPNVVELYSGTSMSSPHQAGAAVLVRQARPTWTVPEMKSALAMTADETVLLEDQVTPANGFAGGAGRIRVDKAINAGLVLDETNARYIAANPATGGNVSDLNQPSMANGRCQGSCTFVRNFRNTRSTTQSYRVILEGVSGRVSPRTLKVVPGETAPLTITVSGAALTPGVWSHGKVRLVPINAAASVPVLHLPVAVRVPVPTTVVFTQSGISGAAGSDQQFSFVVPAGRPRLIVTTSGGTGDSDLFVGTTPTTAFVCASEGGTNAETCSITNPAGGTWYARINGFTAFTGVTIVAEHE